MKASEQTNGTLRGCVGAPVQSEEKDSGGNGRLPTGPSYSEWLKKKVLTAGQ